MRLELDGNTICALYCLQYLARKSVPSRREEIARAGRIGKVRIGRALAALQRHGLVAGRRGGGWNLARPAGEITVSDVQDAVKGLPRSGRSCRIEYDTCPYRSVCPLTPVCTAVDEGVREALASCDLALLARQVPSLPTCVEEKARAARSR